MSGSQHNLDISKYSFEEILGLFDLSYDISEDEMKRAKRKVLMTHPDKSRLDPQYFLFYKKAYEFIVNYYNEKIKHEERDNRRNTTYTPPENNDVGQQQINGVIKKMDKSNFNKTFNTLFENNMVVKPDESRNEWFRDNSSQYSGITATSKDNMGRALEQIKQQQGSLIRHTGIQTMYSSGGTNLYDDNTDQYVTSDPFSKLKFDDLRKVHKDQTVLAVSEKDYANVKKYSSTDHLIRERGQQEMTPLSSQASESIISRQQREHEQMILRKQHESNLKMMEYQKKNQNVLGHFLKLTR